MCTSIKLNEIILKSLSVCPILVLYEHAWIVNQTNSP